MTPAAIFDVDGTLCNVESVRHHLGVGVPGAKRDYNRFHEESVNCPPHQWVVDRARWMAEQDLGIIVVTARKARWFNHTWWWLRENRVPFDALHMRDDWDQRPDYVVKKDILERIRRRWEPVIAFDDNPAVIRLWEEEGISTVRVPGWVG